MSRVFRVDPNDIEIPERVLAARLGFRGVGRIPEEFEKVFKEAMEMAHELAKPVALHDDFEIEKVDNAIEVAGEILSGRSVEDHIAWGSSLTLMVGTLGDEFDRGIERYHDEGEELLSFFLDGIGSEMVEYFIRKLDAHLREIHGEGGPRVSPGYGDLPLYLNDWIVKTLGAQDIGVSCDPQTHIMLPRKTVSAIIAWR